MARCFLICLFHDNIDIYEKTRDSASRGDPAGGFGKFHDFNPTILNTDIYIFQYVFAPYTCTHMGRGLVCESIMKYTYM